jgi:hypothetical protein
MWTSSLNTEATCSDRLCRLLFFKGHRDRRVGREANLLAFDIGDQAQVDEVMMAFVPAVAAVGLGELDSTILNAVDGPNVDAVGPDHFHMRFDISHRALSFPSSDPMGVTPAMPGQPRRRLVSGLRVFAATVGVLRQCLVKTRQYRLVLDPLFLQQRVPLFGQPLKLFGLLRDPVRVAIFICGA